MSKDKRKNFLPERSDPIGIRKKDPVYRPTTPPLPAFGNVGATKIVVDEMLKYANPLPPLKDLKIENGTHHVATSIGNVDGRGHRVTGPLTSEIHDFLEHKYLRYYGFLDGVMRFCYLRAEGGARTVLLQYISEFLVVMRDGGDVSCFNARKWRNGRFAALFTVVNSVNRRRDDFDCPVNDLSLIASLKPDHPRYNDALTYLRYYEDSSVFGYISGKFAKLVKKLAQDVREYDVNIQLKDHTFGYKIKKGHFDSVAQYIETTRIDPMPVVRVAALEVEYNRQQLVDKCKSLAIEMLYVDNLRVLYFKYSGHSIMQMRASEAPICERNLYQFIAHDYKKIGNGFFSSNTGESDAMELIRNNMATIECHIRPKYGKFFLAFKRLEAKSNVFQIICTLDSKKTSFQSTTVLQARYDSATFLGYITNGHMVITDLLRVDEREANSDLTRAAFDDREEKNLCTMNFAIHGAFNDQDAYDVILRSEYGVFRAKSLVKYRVYDKVGWFYDYIQTMGLFNFESLYDVLDPKMSRIIESVKCNLRDVMPKNVQMLVLNDDTDDLIVTLDNRFIPPLIVGSQFVPTVRQRGKNFQALSGDLYQLNKYYVLSKATSKQLSIDPPDQPFYEGYDDGIFRYKPCVANLNVTTFARFPPDWHDEIYSDGQLDYKKNYFLEQEAKKLSISAEEEGYIEEVEVYKPFHDNKEELFFAQFRNMKLDLEPNCFMRKKNHKRRDKKVKNLDCLGDKE